MKCIVTGGAGFIGSNLVERLLKDKHEVVVVDDFSLGKKENLNFAKDNKNLIIYEKGICDYDIEDCIGGVDVVFHVAALPRVQYSIQHPLETNKVNIEGTLNLLRICKEENIKRFIFSSSSSVYGDQDTLPLIESMKPNPMSPYALQKSVSEYYCKLFYEEYGLETIMLRYFNVFGPRQDPKGDYACLIPKFIDLISKGIRPTINGDGKQTRDFTYISDVVDANIKAMNTTYKECFGQVFNIGSGQNRSVNEVTMDILRLTNKNIEPLHGPAKKEPYNTLASIWKAGDMLGWRPKIKFKEGLKRTYQHFRN